MPPMPPLKTCKIQLETKYSEPYMTIEEYLLSCDPYRSTTLPTAWPHPLRLCHAPELQTRLLPLNGGISDILEDHGLPDDTVFLPYYATKALYPRGGQAVNLLYIFFPVGGQTPQHLEPLKDALVRFLAENGIYDIHVEIVNKDLVFNPSLFPLPPQLALIAAFEKAKSRQVDILHDKLSAKWRILCPFNVGGTHADARPALVVMTDPNTVGDWHDIAIALKGELLKALDEKDKHSFQDIEIQFLPGDLSFLTASGGDVSYTQRANIGEVPGMGWSVGIKGDDTKNTGTLGGYATLTMGDEIIPGALTTYHVVRPSPTANNRKMLQEMDQHGRLGKDTIEIESLARNDRNATLADLGALIDGTKSQIRAYDDNIKSRELERETVPSRLSLMKDVNQKSHHSLLDKRKMFESGPRLLGKLINTSGNTIFDGRIVDWAFIKLDDHNFNSSPNKMFPVPEEHQPWQYDPNLGEPLPQGTPLKDFGTLEKGGYYMKRGRSTGVTAGICHGTAVCCNWTGKEDSLRYDHSGKQIEVSRTVTE